MDEDALQQLNEDIREHPSLTDIKDWNGLATSYINGQKTIGEQGDKMKGAIYVPGEDATDLERSQFFGRIGRPDEASGYKFQPPEGTPEDFAVPKSFQEKFPEFAHGIGLSSDQAQGMFSFFVENTMSDTAADAVAADQVRNEVGTALKQEWGKNFDNKAAMIDAMIQQHFPGGMADKMMELAMSDTGFANAFANIGGTMTEDNNTNDKGGSGGGAGGSRNLETVMAERNAIMGDREHPYFTKSAVGHAEAVDQMTGLTQEMLDLQAAANT
jgi:hypothetical protein